MKPGKPRPGDVQITPIKDYCNSKIPPASGGLSDCPSSAWAMRSAEGLAAGIPRLPGVDWIGSFEAPLFSAATEPGVEGPSAVAGLEGAGDGRAAAPLDAAVEVELPSAPESVWLMPMSCSRLLTCTSWLMYSLGSVVAVGSWFCISVTSSVRKSFAEMLADEVFELLLALVPFVEASMGAAVLAGNF